MAIYNLSTLKSFPSATGHGRNTTGGRGGTVYKVTNLNDSGAGSFRDAVSTSNRIIVFAVGGTITLSSNLTSNASNLTIAGESAPGGGIAVVGREVVFNGQNLIIRHVRFRGGDTLDAGRDALRILTNPTTGTYSNYIFDHISVSWGKDEVFSFEVGTSVNSSMSNITVQNSIVSEGFGGKNLILWGENFSNVSFIRNLFANSPERSIRAGSGGVNVVFEEHNNVIYAYTEAIVVEEDCAFDAGGNVFITGHGSGASPIRLQDVNNNRTDGSTTYWLSDNVRQNGSAATVSLGNDATLGTSVGSRQFASDYQLISSSSTKSTVLGNVGARAGISGADTTDALMISNATNETGGSYVSSQPRAYPTLSNGTYASDTTIPGIPNTFVTEHGISSASQVKSTWTIDGNTINNTAGYTAIEIYLFSLTGDLTLTENQITVPVYTHNTLKAFPTADGFGKYASGGRGGTVIKVTNLNASGAGSFLAAIQTTGTRTIVFTVSGTISYGGTNDGFILPVGAGNCTIAGETSPGGIAIKGARFWVRSGNFICRHMRFHQWPGNVGGNNNDAVTFDGTYSGSPLTNMIFDHCSVSYGTDGNMDIRNTWGATVQYCLFYGNDKSNLINANSKNVSYIKNVWSATYERAVRANTIAHTDLTLEQINNIIHCVPWNAGITLGLRATFENNVFTWSTAYGGTFSTSAWGTAAVDAQNNEPNECCPENTYIYLNGNVYDTSRWTSGIVGTRGNPYIETTPYYRSEYTPLPTTGLETYLLNNVGAGQNTTTQGGRTSLDQTAINNVANRLGDPTVSSGAFPTLGSGTYPTDTTIPGIPNTFVSTHGITSANQVITNWDFGTYQVVNNAGYTALEIYLFSLTGDLTAGTLSEGSSPAQIGKTLKSLRFGGSKGKKFYQGNTILKRAKLG